MHKLNEPNVARKILGGVFALVALINLIANLSWLRTGDIHRPQLHIFMRGGWKGFWFTTILACIIGIIGIYLLVTSEPKIASKNKTALSDEEKKNLKKMYSRNIAFFVIFWPIFIPSAILFNYLFLSIAIFVILFGAINMYSIRCPNCGYRLAYFNQFILPSNCPQCKIGLK